VVLEQGKRAIRDYRGMKMSQNFPEPRLRTTAKIRSSRAEVFSSLHQASGLRVSEIL
jgi:hypothetical protein